MGGRLGKRDGRRAWRPAAAAAAGRDGKGAVMAGRGGAARGRQTGEVHRDQAHCEAAYIKCQLVTGGKCARCW